MTFNLYLIQYAKQNEIISDIIIMKSIKTPILRT